MATSLLLFESDENARVAYVQALSEAGCMVSIATDSAHAYEVAMANVPDVIVVGFDNEIRDDRFGLCKRLGAEPRTRQVPILLTSTAVEQRDLELATTTGVLALVLESRDAAKLVSAVRGVVAARLRPTAIRMSLDSTSNEEASRRDKRA